MTGERCLCCDSRRVDIADLADEDHVGILAQRASQPVGEGDAARFAHLHLVDAVELVLDRVFDGDHVAGRIVHLRERRVQRGRLSRPGRTGAQQHAEGRPHDAQVVIDQRRGHAQVVQADEAAGLVEEPQHHLLAVQRGDHRRAHVDGTAVDLERELTVLRTAALNDVQVGEHLDAARDGHAHLDREFDRIGQRTVDAVPHANLALVAFDVDVGCPAAHALRNDPVDHLHHRGVLVDRQTAAVFLGWPAVVAQLEGLDVHVGARQRVVHRIEHSRDLARRSRKQADTRAALGERGDRLGVERVRRRHEDPAVEHPHRQHEESAAHLLGDHVGRRRVGLLDAQVGEGNFELRCHAPSDADLVERPDRDERTPQFTAALGLQPQGLVELQLVDDPLAEEDLTERRPGRVDPLTDLAIEYPDGACRNLLKLRVGSIHRFATWSTKHEPFAPWKVSATRPPHAACPTP